MNKKITARYRYGGMSEIPVMNFGGDLLDPSNPTLGSAGQGAMTGAQIGGTIGSAVPGVGTAIGAGAGAVIGAGVGAFRGHKANQQMEEAEEAANVGQPAQLTSNPYGVQVAEHGLEVINPFINIERGELLVDPESGSIIDDYNSNKYSPHSKDGEESTNNFVQAKEGGVVIPRKYRDTYLNQPNVRSGIIRDVRNKQADREMFGEDIDGNKVSFANMEKDYSSMDKKDFSKRYKLGGKVSQYNLGGEAEPIWDTPRQYYNNPYEGMPTNMPPRQPQLPQVPGPQLPAPTGQPIDFGETSGFPGFNNLGKQQPYYGRGDAYGIAGTAVAGLGPLATTLAGGIDRQESNPFERVSSRAENIASNAFRDYRNMTVRDARLNANAAKRLNRNRVSSFSSLLANEQNITDSLNRNVQNIGAQFGAQEAQLTSGLAMQGDLYSASGKERMEDRLDRNRDNYYTNLSSNFSNLGVQTQNLGRQFNKQEANDIRFNTLKELSPYFTIDREGNITFEEG